jgi:hypothetical protein
MKKSNPEIKHKHLLISYHHDKVNMRRLRRKKL